MNKPLTYEDAYPGRFLTAGHFDGKKVTLTISDVYTDPGLDKKKPKTVLSFVGKKLELVIPKTNGFCLRQMFGRKLADWVGKRVTFYATTCMFGDEEVDCIRVWGSPDIAEDMHLKVPQGRNKPIPMTMHAMKAGAKAEIFSPAAPASPESSPAILAAWSALGWSKEDSSAHMAEYKGGDYLAELSTLIDEQNAKESF